MIEDKTLGKRFSLLAGDCLARMCELAENSVDAIVTDPPYGLAFMGKRWDYDVPSVDIWREALRVLKPGGHMLAFGGTRTYHRMVVAIEDAGFEIRDQLAWVYGSGFPKSLAIDKAIDKMNGDQRPVVGEARAGASSRAFQSEDKTTAGKFAITSAASAASAAWSGWGTALKPALEPICLARKPISEKNIAANVLKWGTGALNIDGSRIGTEQVEKGRAGRIAAQFSPNAYANGKGYDGHDSEPGTSIGRFPANLLLGHSPNCTDDACDMFDCAVAVMDEQSGISPSNVRKAKTGNNSGDVIGWKGTETNPPGDSRGASRFFYVAKASKRERNAGCDALKAKPVHRLGEGIGEGLHPEAPTFDKNHHPTVKPVKLMSYLCRLITPPGGLILDPFAGSGSTGVAAIGEGFRFVGIEREPEYISIGLARITHAEKKVPAETKKQSEVPA